MTRYETYIAALKTAGFIATERAENRLYRKATDHTALIVNLTNQIDEYGETVAIVYGATVIGASPDLAEYFARSGERNDTCKLRHLCHIADDADASAADDAIRAAFAVYAVLDREAVRAEMQARQKAFHNRIHAVLKPLGYKKKAHRWQKVLANGWTLDFDAQKSAYSDQFYFNYAAYRATDNRYLPLVSGRLRWTNADGQESDIFNWQLLSDETIATRILQPTVRVLTTLEDKLSNANGRP